MFGCFPIGINSFWGLLTPSDLFWFTHPHDEKL
jgi:hypothetical protein